MLTMPTGSAATIATRFGLGVPIGAVTYADRGELGRIWRMETDRGRWAVKEANIPVDPADAARDVAFQLAAIAAGVPMPRPVLTPDGEVLLPASQAGLTSTAVRVYEWVDLAPAGSATGRDIGAVTATVHLVRHAASDPVAAWFAEPAGAGALADLLSRAHQAGAQWAPELSALLPDLLDVESLVSPTDPARVMTCHRDINVDNIRHTVDGQLVALDWENSGPLQPERELALILADVAADLSVAEAAAGYEEYLSAGGPARLAGPADFSSAIAVRGSLLRFYGGRALDGAASPEDRQRSERRINAMLRSPLTRDRIAELLRALP